MRHTTILLASMFASLGCSPSPQPPTGVQLCEPNTGHCPEGYFCAQNNKCWKNGTGPIASGGSDGTGGGSSGAGATSSSGVTGTGGTSAVTPLPIKLASFSSNTYSCVFDTNNVYCIHTDACPYNLTSQRNICSGSVMKAPLSGGTPILLASVSNADPWGIAVDATNVYWVNQETSGNGKGSVMKVPLGGGSTTTLASGQDFPEGIAVDATSVYWTNSSDSGSIMKVALGGGTPTTLASRLVYPSKIVVDATSVYWDGRADDQNLDSVMKVALGGGTPITLASGQNHPSGITIDATSVYWMTEGKDVVIGNVHVAGAGTVVKEPLDGGLSTTLALGDDSLWLGESVAVDADSVYFDYYSTIDGYGVMKVPVSGGTPTTLASSFKNGISGIAVDATSVYFVSGADLMKVTPK
jgi:hypothetical protein